LKPLDRDPLVAFYFEGRSLKELSVLYNSPIGTIKRRLHTARGRLKAAMGEFQPA
jgi:RNA polymerase sigma-70 factor (ECF subfamily)